VIEKAAKTGSQQTTTIEIAREFATSALQSDRVCG